MKLAIFGGTGLVGSALVDLAVQQSHEVTILARDTHKTRAIPPGVRVVTGDALDPAAVRQTLDDGCGAVMSALGGLYGPESLSLGTALVLDGMRALGLRRLVVLQGMHLTVPGDAPSPGRWLVQAFMNIRAKEIVHHSELMWHDLQNATDIDWTLVRIPRVGKDNATGHCKSAPAARPVEFDHPPRRRASDDAHAPAARRHPHRATSRLTQTETAGYLKPRLTPMVGRKWWRGSGD